MCSPLSDLAKRERVFSSYFLSHSRSEESGLCPSYRYPWETQRATEGKGCSLPLGLWRGEGREEDVLRASFFASCALTSTSKGALRPRRHSGRKADHYISLHQSRREASYLSLIHLHEQGIEQKESAYRGHGRFEDLTWRRNPFVRKKNYFFPTAETKHLQSRERLDFSLCFCFDS